MERVFYVVLIVLSLSSMPFSAYAMGKKPETGDSKGTSNVSDRHDMAEGNPGSPNLSGVPVAPSVSAPNSAPVENVNKPTNPNLPSNTGVSGTTGMNGTGMGSGTSH
jgi:hypothetical protein